MSESHLVSCAGDTITETKTSFGVGSSPSVVYLGVPCGPDVNREVVCPSLESQVYSPLSRWGTRARTYRSRLNAMVFSILWYFNPHVALPPTVIRCLLRF
ncbi:hypothetical protein PHMEG_00016406 [Phytophthora megakarya]|uniref:Uncharacterized protein n=1 Tax=Phytophthora megakarya TaxID=4795 RepID=A0A225W012_9STRA|nr:hypothetical protein PHMEG_00016406 [Phytophthora megakarya]